jgi:hypothetical protein
MCQEAHSRRIELQEDDPDAVEHMISYMYTFDYKDEEYGDSESTVPSTGSNDGTAETMDDERQIPPEAVADAQEDSASTRGEDHPAHFSSVRVYALADKYDISPLKELARQKFCNWAENNWACEDFSAVAREVFESTPKDDRGLRDIIIQLVAKHADIFIQKDGLRQLIEDIGDLGLGVLCQLFETHSETESALTSRIEDLENENAVLNRQLKDVELGLKRKSKDIDSTISKINNLVDCQRCKNGFNVSVEAYMYGGLTIRCKGCQVWQ